LFLGTPHQGSPTARYGKILAQIANSFVVGTQISRYTGPIRADLLSSLRTGEDGLLRVAEDFRVHTAGIKIFSFVEQKNMKGLNQRVKASLKSTPELNAFRPRIEPPFYLSIASISHLSILFGNKQLT
jgi:hypothetical protein